MTKIIYCALLCFIILSCSSKLESKYKDDKIKKSLNLKDSSIVDYYSEFIKVKNVAYGSQKYLQKEIKLPRANCQLYDFIDKNTANLEYILMNFASIKNDSVFMQIRDSNQLQQSYIEFLKSDTVFNKIMNDLFSKSICNLHFKDTVSIDELLNTAVKFFSISRINKDGNYVGHVCSGDNNLQTTEKKRNAYLEAFSFNIIIEYYEGGDKILYKEFVKSIKEVYKINLGINQEERLLRAQGAMYMLMRNNHPLREILIKEYKKKKDYLPFVLKNI